MIDSPDATRAIERLAFVLKTAETYVRERNFRIPVEVPLELDKKMSLRFCQHTDAHGRWGFYVFHAEGGGEAYTSLPLYVRIAVAQAIPKLITKLDEANQKHVTAIDQVAEELETYLKSLKDFQ